MLKSKSQIRRVQMRIGAMRVGSNPERVRLVVLTDLEARSIEFPLEETADVVRVLFSFLAATDEKAFCEVLEELGGKIRQEHRLASL